MSILDIGPQVSTRVNDPASVDAALFELEPYAEAVAGVAQHLFDSDAPAPARNVVVSLLAERALRYPDAATPLGDLDLRTLYLAPTLLPGDAWAAGRVIVQQGWTSGFMARTGPRWARGHRPT